MNSPRKPIVKYSAPRIKAAVKFNVKIVIDEMKADGKIFNPKTILSRVKDKLISPSKKKKRQSLKDFNQQEMISLERFKKSWGNTIKESNYYNEWLNESRATERRRKKAKPSILKKESSFKKEVKQNKTPSVRGGPRIHFDPNILKGGRRKRTRRKRKRKRTRRKGRKRTKHKRRKGAGTRRKRTRRRMIGCRKKLI